MKTVERLASLMQHLQLDAACFATQIPGDIADLAAQFPERVTGLVLCAPTRLDPRPFAQVAPRLLIIAGEAGGAETSRRAVAQLRGAQEHILPDYNAQGRSDVVADHTAEVVGAIIGFLQKPCSGLPTAGPAAASGTHSGLRADSGASAVLSRTLAMGTGLGGAGAALHDRRASSPTCDRWLM